MEKIPPSTPRSRLLYGAAAAVILLAGVCAGFFGARLFFPSDTPAPDSIVREGGYQFINPLISCDISEDVPYTGFDGLRKELLQESDRMIARGDATRISIYFRDMNEGRWTGVRTSDLFIPASLMKVPLLMAVLKSSQTDSQLLEESFELSVPEDQNALEYFKPAVPLVIGSSYTVQELLNAMIKGSDNNAAYVLAGAVSTSSLETIYEDSNVPPNIDETTDTLSPQDYMRFFRVLYNSALLGKTRSQAALELLGETDFPGGIVAGVPAGTSVVHKFGERTVGKKDASGRISVAKRELHDCGIVYYAGSPYGLCIMTEGDSFPTLESDIAALSKTAYSAVDDGILKKR